MLPNDSADMVRENSRSSIRLVLGYIMVGLLSVLVALVAGVVFRPSPQFAYKVVSLQAQLNKGADTQDGNQSPTSINLKEDELSIMGKEGWELVNSYMEIETVHTNYGRSEYVTGLQPNVRPQRIVLIFKKQL